MQNRTAPPTGRQWLSANWRRLCTTRIARDTTAGRWVLQTLHDAGVRNPDPRRDRSVSSVMWSLATDEQLEAMLDRAKGQPWFPRIGG